MSCSENARCIPEENTGARPLDIRAVINLNQINIFYKVIKKD